MSLKCFQCPQNCGLHSLCNRNVIRCKQTWRTFLQREALKVYQKKAWICSLSENCLQSRHTLFLIPFLKVKFANKGNDALNVSNILNQKSVNNKIPPYFQYKQSPCILLQNLQLQSKFASRTGICKGTLEIVSKEVLWSVRGSYQTIWGPMLHGILDDNHLKWHPPLIRHYTNFWPYYLSGPFTEFDFLPNCKRFP